MPKIPDVADTPFLFESANDLSAGSIDFGEEHLLPPNTAAHLLNVEITFAGRRQKRRGVRARGTIGTQQLDATTVIDPNGLFTLADPNKDFHRLVGHYGNRLFQTNGDSDWNFVASTVSMLSAPSFASQGRATLPSLFIHNCAPYTANTSLPYGNLVALDKEFGATEIITVRPRASAWFNNRLFCFNSAMTNHGPDYLMWSAVLDGRDFDHGLNLQVDPDSGDQGTGIVPLRGDVPQLLLFKERSIHMLDLFWDTDGYYPGSANALDFNTARLRRVVNGTGCIATRSIIEVPGLKGGQGGDILFLSREGIRSMNRSATDAQGGAGIPLSLTIQGQIDRINWARADQSSAIFWDNVAYFSVPVDGAENPNFIIAYNLLRDAWFFIDWTVSDWASSKLGTETKLYFLNNSQGSDGFSSYSLGHHLYETNTGNVDPFQDAINYDEQHRSFTFSDTGQPIDGLQYKKIWKWLQLKMQSAATGATLALQFKVDDEDEWNTLDHVFLQPSDAYPPLPVQLPFSFNVGKLVRKQFSLHNIPPGYKLQVRLLDDSSFARLKVIEMNLAALRQSVRFLT